MGYSAIVLTLTLPWLQGDPIREALDRYREAVPVLEQSLDKKRFATLVSDLSGLNKRREIELEFMLDGPHTLCRMLRNEILEDGKPPQAYSRNLSIQNPRYKAVLEEYRSKYSVLSFRAEGDPPIGDAIRFAYQHHSWGRSYLDILTDPSTRIESVGPAVFHGRKALEFRFTAEQRVDGKSQRFVMRYFFDPEHQWVCLGIQGLYADTGKIGAETVFDYDFDRMPPTPRSVEIFDISEGKRDLTSRTKVTAIEDLPGLDPALTYLSSYGLPEMPGVSPPSRVPNWAWLALAAVVLALAAWGLRRLAARQASPGTGATP
jgi:hypothetical protein